MSRARLATVVGLYPIVDIDSCERRNIDPLTLLGAVIDGGAALLQIRAKHMPSGALLDLLSKARSLTRSRGVRLIVNDRADLASLSDADGVHVGQDDLSVGEVRRIDERLGVGVSTHSLSELQAALPLAPDYVAFGPVFETSSKDRAEPVVGLEQLRLAHDLARAAGVPLVAIGGLDASRAVAVAGCANAIAVISALFERGCEARTISEQVATLRAQVREAQAMLA